LKKKKSARVMRRVYEGYMKGIWSQTLEPIKGAGFAST
jgi:hypothetical protein